MNIKPFLLSMLSAAALLGSSAVAAVTTTTRAESITELIMSTDLSPKPEAAKAPAPAFSNEPSAADMQPNKIYDYSSNDGSIHASAFTSEITLHQITNENRRGATIARCAFRLYSSTDKSKLEHIVLPRDGFSTEYSENDRQHKSQQMFDIKSKDYTDYNGEKKTFYYRAGMSIYEVTQFKPYTPPADAQQSQQEIANETDIIRAHEARHFDDFTLKGAAFISVTSKDIRPYAEALEQSADFAGDAHRLFDEIRQNSAINLITLEGRATDAEMRKAEKLGLIKTFADIDNYVAKRNKVPIDASALSGKKNLIFKYKGEQFPLTANGGLCTYGKAYRLLRNNLSFDDSEVVYLANIQKKSVYELFALYLQYKFYEKNVNEEGHVGPKPSDARQESDIVALLKEATRLFNDCKGGFDFERFQKLALLINPNNCDPNRVVTAYDDARYTQEYQEARREFIQTSIDTLRAPESYDVTFYPLHVIPKTETGHLVGLTFNILQFLTEDVKTPEQAAKVLDQTPIGPFTEAYLEKEQQLLDRLFKQYNSTPPDSVIKAETTKLAKEYWEQNKESLLQQYVQFLNQLLNQQPAIPERVKRIKRP